MNNQYLYCKCLFHITNKTVNKSLFTWYSTAQSPYHTNNSLTCKSQVQLLTCCLQGGNGHPRKIGWVWRPQSRCHYKLGYLKDSNAVAHSVTICAWLYNHLLGLGSKVTLRCRVPDEWIKWSLKYGGSGGVSNNVWTRRLNLSTVERDMSAILT